MWIRPPPTASLEDAARELQNQLAESQAVPPESSVSRKLDLCEWCWEPEMSGSSTSTACALCLRCHQRVCTRCAMDGECPRCVSPWHHPDHAREQEWRNRSGSSKDPLLPIHGIDTMADYDLKTGTRAMDADFLGRDDSVEEDVGALQRRVPIVYLPPHRDEGEEHQPPGQYNAGIPETGRAKHVAEPITDEEWALSRATVRIDHTPVRAPNEEL